MLEPTTEVYEGRRCCKDGTRLKYRSCQSCVACKERKREERKLQIQAGHYTGTPCRKCGTAEKYNGGGACVSCARRRARAKYHANPKHSRDYTRKYNTGWDPDAFEKQLAAQHYRCAICPRELTLEARKSNTASADHDHKTGMTRGIPCAQCNFMLGNAHDDPTILRRGADYLERYANLKGNLQ